MNMQSELGGSRLKLIIFLAVFAIVIYAGYMYIPVTVDAYYFKDVMQNKVDMAAAQGQNGDWVREQLVKSGPEYHVPPDMTVTSILKEGRLEVRVQFIRPISFPGYTYNYEFDHTAKSSGFLSK